VWLAFVKGGAVVIPSFQRRLASISPRNWLLILIFLCLVPFINKPLFIDDTLFVRSAEQIQKHPLDFYGFNINWFDQTLPMSESTENPPLTSYYIALAALLVGWSERALHLAFLLPALAAGWGIYSLAQNYCRRPFVAALIAVSTPVFLISATSLMSDVILLAFWVWALVAFENGLRKGGVPWFVGCGCLAGLAVLTKFFGLALVPLLAVYGLCRLRRAGWWMIAFVIPLLFAAGYEWLGYRLYGHGLFLSAAQYASGAHEYSSIKPWETTIIGLGFAGGCFLPVLFYTPLLWSRRVALMGPCLVAAGMLVIPRMLSFVWVLWAKDGSLNWGVFLVSSVLTVGGIYIVLLTVADLWNKRDAVSLLLFLWMFGVLVFTIKLNWTINGRCLLPGIPALGILLARRLEHHGAGVESKPFWPVVWPALLAGVISLFLVKADYDLAGIYKTAARTLLAQYQKPGTGLWFHGHWGFQYYMEQGGATAAELKSPPSKMGDIIVVPAQDKEDYTMVGSSRNRLLEIQVYGTKNFCATIDVAAGAGFYAANLGPLPFAITGLKPQCFWIYQVTGTNGDSGGNPAPSRARIPAR
jgi:4-amino-4-deoxy-L-arabinose transferase-like glycosyltransferase